MNFRKIPLLSCLILATPALANSPGPIDGDEAFPFIVALRECGVPNLMHSRRAGHFVVESIRCEKKAGAHGSIACSLKEPGQEERPCDGKPSKQMFETLRHHVPIYGNEDIALLWVQAKNIECRSWEAVNPHRVHGHCSLE